MATRKELRELTDPAAGLRRARARRRSVQPGRQRHRSRRAGGEPRHAVGCRRRPADGPADHHQPAGVGRAQSISFSPDSKRVAVPGRPRDRGIWDVASGRRVGTPLAIGSADVADTIFAEGGRTLIASDEEGSVSFVDLRTRRAIRPPLSVGDEAADSLDLSPDGRLLAVATFGGSVFVWNAKTGDPYGSPLGADTSPVGDVEFSPDGRTLVSAHVRSAVVWDMSGRAGDRRATGRRARSHHRHGVQPRRQAACRGSLRRRRAGGRHGDAPTDAPPGCGARSSLPSRFTPDGKRLAIGTIDGRVRLFDPRTRSSVELPLERRGRSRLAGGVQPGRAAARGRRGPERWRGRLLPPAATGRGPALGRRSAASVGRSIVPGAGSVMSLACSPDGELLATGSAGSSTCGMQPPRRATEVR